MKVLVIGGAGFIGGHLVDGLIREGRDVRVVDNLDPLVHPTEKPPSTLPAEAEFRRLDVRDRFALQESLAGVGSIFFLGGVVGVADSMYRIRHYVEVNSLGAANLLDALANEKHAVQDIIVSSSVTVYGEGNYACPIHGPIHPGPRSADQIARHDWELRCRVIANGRPCGIVLTSTPTAEDVIPAPQSVYAITKRNQEELFLAVGRAYGIRVTVLRYFNVYGPRQALSNPYTGVAKIFAARLARGEAPLIYEDGLQCRDFVHVDDVVRANLLALERQEVTGEVLNVGTGKPTSVFELTSTLARIYSYRGEIEPTGLHRVGDVRHCFADLTKIKATLGFTPRKIFPAGLEDLLQGQHVSTDGSADTRSAAELGQRGLIR